AGHPTARPRGAALRGHPPVPSAALGRAVPEDLDAPGLATAGVRKRPPRPAPGRARPRVGGGDGDAVREPVARLGAGEAARPRGARADGGAPLPAVRVELDRLEPGEGVSPGRRGVERGGAAGPPAVLRPAGIPGRVRGRRSAGAGGGASGPRAVQLPRAARAAGEEERSDRGPLPRERGLLRRPGAGEPLVLPDAVLLHRAG